MTIREIVRAGLSRIETIRTRTALNPLLWLLGLSLPLLLGAAVLIPDRVVQLSLIGVAGSSIFLTFLAYFVTLLREPQRLQSEEFLLQQIELLSLERKGLPPVPARPDLSSEAEAGARIEEDGS